ncbi:hypothetical protein HWV62_22515 [Athelia sp. TMB]|nr:hypothetical protein HWV62_22515 [Athelia sp. TMB]
MYVSTIATTEATGVNASEKAFDAKSLTKEQIDEYRATADPGRNIAKSAELVNSVLPEYVYFKSPSGKYLTRLDNQIGWYGIKWEPTTPDSNCRFKIIQIPSQPGNFYVTGSAPGHQLQVSMYKSGKYDADVDKANQLNTHPTYVFRLVSLGGDDIYLVRDATYDRPTVFLTNFDNQRYKLWDHNNNSWMDSVRSSTYANDNNRIGIERAVVKTEIYNVQYNIDAKEIIALNPTVAIQKTLENRTNSDASQTIAYTYTKSEEGNWNNKVGIELGQMFKFKAGVPFIATVEGEISFKESYEHSWGGSTTTSTSVTTSTTVTVPARTTIKVTVLIYNSRLNIPFTYTERITHYDGSREEKNKEGIYRNVDFINDHATSEII